jgi:Zn-dependent protease
MNLENAGMMVAIFAGFVFCIVVHECAHGLVALWLGDTTARDMGRLTLNPIPHIDPFMSVLLPGILLLSGSPVLFGGAKPVPVNPLNFAINRYWGMLLVAIAGPVSNLLLAVALMLLLNLFPSFRELNLPAAENFFDFVLRLVVINLVLAFFNMIPIPPLDGSKVLAAFMPRGMADVLLSYQAGLAGMMLVCVLVVSGGTRFLTPLIIVTLEFLERFLIFHR